MKHLFHWASDAIGIFKPVAFFSAKTGWSGACGVDFGEVNWMSYLSRGWNRALDGAAAAEGPFTIPTAGRGLMGLKLG